MSAASPRMLYDRLRRDHMGLNRASASRLLSAAQVALEDLFPGTVRIAGGEPLAAVCVGGSGKADFGLGGRLVQGVRNFRVRKDLMGAPPRVGTSLSWVRDGGGEQVLEFTIMEVPDRPHEPAWTLRCEPKGR